MAQTHGCDGATPREAARRWRWRPHLVDMLMRIENAWSVQALPGDPPDTRWIWTELALERP